MKQKLFASTALFKLIKNSYIDSFPAPKTLKPVDVFNEYLQKIGIKGDVSFITPEFIFTLRQATNTSHPGAVSLEQANKNRDLENALGTPSVANAVIEDLADMMEWMQEEDFFTPKKRASLKLLQTDNI